MNMHIGTPLLLAAVAVASPFAVGQSTRHDTHAVAQAAPSAPSTREMFDGEVRKVDRAAGRITLKHGELKSLEMPAMTMVFQARDKAMLETVKAGDRVRFSAEKSGSTLTVTAIEPAK
jgi:Cu/Ag efflux protein CusF